MTAKLTPISTRKDGYEKTLALLPKVLKEIDEILTSGRTRDKLDASRVVGQLINFLAPPEEEKPPALPDADRREHFKRLLRERPAALQELAREAGVEIRALPNGGALTMVPLETHGTESDP